MFNKHYCMILSGEEMVDELTKIAANHKLYCMYKIGVYGKERQHELYITGKPWDYWRFIRTINRPTKEVTNMTQES